MTGGYSAYVTDLGDPAGAYISLVDSVWRYAGLYAATNLASTHTGSDVVTCTTTYVISGTPTGGSDRTISLGYTSLRASLTEGSPTTLAVTFAAHTVRPTLA